jgi:iron complex transport system substrate-binding protein
MTRTLRTAAVAVLIAVLVAACGSETPGDSSPADGPWSYASGNGEVVKLDKRPERIIAHAYSAAALMEFGIRPTAVYADGPVKSDVGLKGVDFEGVEIIGETWDKTATTRPTSTC